jgi:hypothetical protein
MRALPPSAAAALAAPSVALAALVHIELDPPLRVCSWGNTLEWAGQSYLAAGLLGTIDATDESTDQPRGLRFTLSGIPSALISQVVGEAVGGKTVTVRIGILDPDTHQVLHAEVEWEGQIDSMSISGDGSSESISVVAESSGVDLIRAVPVRYTDTDQQRLFPGDSFFEFVSDQAEREVVWPSAEFFQR